MIEYIPLEFIHNIKHHKKLGSVKPRLTHNNDKRYVYTLLSSADPETIDPSQTIVIRNLDTHNAYYATISLKDYVDFIQKSGRYPNDFNFPIRLAPTLSNWDEWERDKMLRASMKKIDERSKEETPRKVDVPFSYVKEKPIDIKTYVSPPQPNTNHYSDVDVGRGFLIGAGLAGGAVYLGHKLRRRRRRSRSRSRSRY